MEFWKGEGISTDLFTSNKNLIADFDHESSQDLQPYREREKITSENDHGVVSAVSLTRSTQRAQTYVVL